MQLSMKPVFIHDCKCCRYAGNVVAMGSLWDLYYCPTHKELIARNGHDGPDYRAAPVAECYHYRGDHPLRMFVEMLHHRKAVINDPKNPNR